MVYALKFFTQDRITDPPEILVNLICEIYLFRINFKFGLKE